MVKKSTSTSTSKSTLPPLYAMIQERSLENFKHRYALTTVDLMTEHDFIDSINKGAPQFCLDVLKTCPVHGSEEAVRYLTEYSKTVGGKVLAEKSLQTNLVTLTHGDFWNNNMLFKKDPQNGQLLKNVLVDFQATKLASPVIDITNFLFSSVKPSVRREFHSKFVQNYFAGFRKTLEILNCSCTIAFEEFMDDYRMCCEHGFLVALVFLTATGALDGMDVDVAAPEDNEGGSVFIRRVQKWIHENPEKGREVATEIVQLVEEYSRSLVAT